VNTWTLGNEARSGKISFIDLSMEKEVLFIKTSTKKEGFFISQGTYYTESDWNRRGNIDNKLKVTARKRRLGVHQYIK